MAVTLDRAPRTDEELWWLVQALWGHKVPRTKVCADHDEVKRFVRMSGAKVAGKQGWTDVARFTAAGVPAFNYGPGLPDLCHRADEYCPIPNLGTVYENLARFLRESA